MEEGHVGSSLLGSMPQWYEKGRWLKIGVPPVKEYSCLKCGYVESYTVRNGI